MIFLLLYVLSLHQDMCYICAMTRRQIINERLFPCLFLLKNLTKSCQFRNLGLSRIYDHNIRFLVENPASHTTSHEFWGLYRFIILILGSAFSLFPSCHQLRPEVSRHQKMDVGTLGQTTNKTHFLDNLMMLIPKMTVVFYG